MLKTRPQACLPVTPGLKKSKEEYMQKSPAKEVFESPEEETVKKFNRAREWAGLKLRQSILEKFIWPWLGDQSERDILYAAQTILKHNKCSFVN